MSGNQVNRTESTMQMSFGKHKGKLLHELPMDYVRWMAADDVLSNKPVEFVTEMRRIFPEIWKTSEMKMDFGKHNGTLLHEVPKDYLKWMARDNVLSTKRPEFAMEMKRVFPNIFNQ